MRNRAHAVAHIDWTFEDEVRRMIERELLPDAVITAAQLNQVQQRIEERDPTLLDWDLPLQSLQHQEV